MKNIILAIGIFLLSANANAVITYDADFSNAATGGGGGWYYFDPHQATQTFISTGLDYVDQLQLTLNSDVVGITELLGFTFYLNGFEIGSYDYSPGDSAGASYLDFSFASQYSASSDWTLLMDVTTPVCSGCGSLRFETSNPLTLIDNEDSGGTVPAPATLALMGLGLVGFGLSRRRST